ncbi:hypothetical protein V8D89_011693 [Ganoderma adspersum]
MFSFTRMIVSVSAALALVSVDSVLAAPTNLEARAAAVPSPAFVIYTDKFVSADVLPPVDKVKGYNVVALSFLTLKGAQDQAGAYAKLPAAKKASLKSAYSKAGIKLIVSAFGETDTPTTSKANPVTTGNTMAKFVKDQKLDGIDVDYEDLAAMNKGDGAAEKWVTTFTQTLRKTLPKGQFILTHAPLAPWLSHNKQFAAGAYLTINKNVGAEIDWYNIQFYNQGLYTNCEGLLTKSGGAFPGSSVFEIQKNGVDLKKLVIGKPGSAADATNGFMSAATLATCVKQAKAKGWNAGLMFFEFPEADAAFIKTAKGSAFH